MDSYSSSAADTAKNAAMTSRRFGVMKARIGTPFMIHDKGTLPRSLTVQSIHDSGDDHGLKARHPKAKVKVICNHRSCRGATFDTWVDMKNAHDKHDELVRANEFHVIVMRAVEVDKDGKELELGLFSDQPYTEVPRYQEI